MGVSRLGDFHNLPMKTHLIHPKTPRKLKSAYRKAGYKYHRLAQEIGVNVKYLYALIHYGQEPSNEAIRLKLFLPRRPRKPRTPSQPRPPLPEYEQRWRRLTKEQRDQFKKSLFKE